MLIDYGDVVVHVFLDEIRRFYEIERLYRDAPTVDVGELTDRFDRPGRLVSFDRPSGL